MPRNIRLRAVKAVLAPATRTASGRTNPSRLAN